MSLTSRRKGGSARKLQVKEPTEVPHTLPARSQKILWTSKSVIERLPVFREEQEWRRRCQVLIQAHTLVRSQDPNADDSKKRSPKTELLLQIINRRFRQLLPNSLLAIPQAQTALYEQARDYWPLHSEEFQRLESEIS